jgi:uracil-DNA glycosylase family 4
MAAGADGKDLGELADVRAYLDYFRDLGIHDFYRSGSAPGPLTALSDSGGPTPVGATVELAEVRVAGALASRPQPQSPSLPVALQPSARAPSSGDSDIPKLIPFNDLAPLPGVRVAASEKAFAPAAVRADIGDCTRCPLAYGGRRRIVFADGDPNARLMFIGEGPGADEDEQGLPFVGKSGQLLNNMIGAMGLKREQVYIANIVKCRPPANRAPEWIEATTCTQFLVRQMDIVQPEFVVALGATAAMYLLGVRQSLASLRGRWHDVRGARAIITYHPAFLLRDPRQKGEAWKDLQMVMAEMGLKGPGKT